MLSAREAVSYLIDRDLLRPVHLVHDNLAVANVSRRHRNFRVTTDQGPNYLLKQGLGEERALAVANEAAIYRLLGDAPGFPDHYVPRVHSYDEQAGVLVLELLSAAENLREYHFRRARFPVLLARNLAKATSSLHRLPLPENGTVGRKRNKDSPPWVLSVHRPTIQFYQECSSANLQLISMVQEFPEFCDLLSELGREWRGQTLIHGDLRWDNCIVSGKSPSARRTRLKIVDWELAGAGDPCWDVGAVFNDYLGSWLLSIPITGEQAPERFLELARFPLEKMQPALRAFWDSYVRDMELDAIGEERQLLRSVRFAAARLLQTAFEQMQGSSQLTGNVVCFLQLSFNILKRPREAAAHLLGITAPPGSLAA